jgi:replicative DNA helicase
VKTETLPEIPKNLDAERQALAACLSSAAERSRVFELLSVDDFTDLAFRDIFRAILELDCAGQEVSLLTLAVALTTSIAVKDAGGTSFLSSLTTDGVWVLSRRSAASFRQESIRRRTQALGDKMMELAVDRSHSVLDMIGKAEEDFSSIRDGYLSSTRAAVHVSAVLKEIQPCSNACGMAMAPCLEFLPAIRPSTE